MRGVVVRGAELRTVRTQQGLTQAELANRSGVDVKTVRKAEQGKRLDLAPLSRLAEALQIEVGRLILSDGNEAALQARQHATLMNYLRAFDAFDIDGVLNAFHDDAVLEIAGGPNIPFGGVAQGREAIRAAHEQAWGSRRQEPTRHEEELKFHVVGSVITVLGEKAVYLPNGELVRFPCAMVFTFREDRIARQDVHFDTLDYARRFSLIQDVAEQHDA